METVVAVVAVLFVLFLVLAAYTTVKVVGATKRHVDRTITQARRTVEDTALRAKTYAQPGPAGELAQLRLRLRTTMRATQDALHAGAAQDESLKESLDLFRRLSAHGHELDGDLKRLEGEPDRATLAERLPALRERTRRIVESADSLRWAARDRAHRFADDDMDTLSAQIDVEAGALRHWTREPGPEHAHGTGDGRANAPGGRSAQSGSQRAWPEPSAADGTEQTWSDPAAAAHPPTLPEITPPSPARTYPWQKKTRPENTS